MKIDSRSVMSTVTEATGHPFNLFDFGIDTLCQSIGDTMFCICDNVVQMSFERSGGFLDRFKSTMRCPVVPLCKIFAHVSRMPVTPHMPQILFYRPGPADLQVFGLKELSIN